MGRRPDVEWVKSTLERLNIRVVNDRPGRRKKRRIEEVEQNTSSSSSSGGRNTLPRLQTGNNSNTANIILGNTSHGSAAFSAVNHQNNEMNTLFNLGRGSGDISRMSSTTDRESSVTTQYGISSGVLEGMTTNDNVVTPLAQQLGNTFNFNNAIAGFDNSSSPTIFNYQQPQRMSLLENILSRDELQRGVMAQHQESNPEQEILVNLLPIGSNQHYEALMEHHRNLLHELQETTALLNLYHRNAGKNNNIIDNFNQPNNM